MRYGSCWMLVQIRLLRTLTATFRCTALQEEVGALPARPRLDCRTPAQCGMPARRDRQQRANAPLVRGRHRDGSRSAGKGGSAADGGQAVAGTGGGSTDCCERDTGNASRCSSGSSSVAQVRTDLARSRRSHSDSAGTPPQLELKCGRAPGSGGAGRHQRESPAAAPWDDQIPHPILPAPRAPQPQFQVARLKHPGPRLRNDSSPSAASRSTRGISAPRTRASTARRTCLQSRLRWPASPAGRGTRLYALESALGAVTNSERACPAATSGAVERSGPVGRGSTEHERLPSAPALHPRFPVESMCTTMSYRSDPSPAAEAMAKRENISVSFTPHQAAFLDACVASGRYQSASEVVREALRMLEDVHARRGAELERARALIQIGAEQLANGQVVDGDRFFEEWDADLAALVRRAGR